MASSCKAQHHLAPCCVLKKLYAFDYEPNVMPEVLFEQKTFRKRTVSIPFLMRRGVYIMGIFDHLVAKRIDLFAY